MNNNFDRDKLRKWFGEHPHCSVCKMSKADAFHHITGRSYPECKSILNAAPVHNQQCHLYKSGWLHLPKNEVVLLTITYRKLMRLGYKLVKIDRQFMDRYKHHYALVTGQNPMF